MGSSASTTHSVAAKDTGDKAQPKPSAEAPAPGPLYSWMGRAGGAGSGAGGGPGDERASCFGGAPVVQRMAISVGAPNDAKEREADAVAARARSAPARSAAQTAVAADRAWKEMNGSAAPSVQRDATAGVPAADA